MTDLDVIEQRLRRTFQVVAQLPIAPIGVDDEPWRTGASGPPRQRRGRLLVGAGAIALVVAVVSLGVAYGPRSTNNGANPGTGSQATSTFHAVFAPVSTQSGAVLEETAATMTARLRALGHDDTRVIVQHGSIDVSGPTISRADLRLVTTVGAFSIRPVICGAPAYVAPALGESRPSAQSPACQSQYVLSAADLAVNAKTGRPTNVIPPDPSLASYPSTPSNSDFPAGSVLLSADPSTGPQPYQRYALGAAQFDGSEIASASARDDVGATQWVVDLELQPSAFAQWDTVAEQSFHQYLAFDLDGRVLAAPLIQPNATNFTSFGGEIQVEGNFAATQAKGLAAILGSGPLPVALRLQSLTRVSALLGSGGS